MEKLKKPPKPKIRNKRLLSLQDLLVRSSVPKWVLLALLAPVIAFLLSSKSLTGLKAYQVGDVAESSVKADLTYLVKDSESTDERRRQAEESVPAVYDYDPTMDKKISARLHSAFADMRKLFFESSASDPEEGQTNTEEIMRTGLDNWNQAFRMDLDGESFRILVRANFSEDVENLILFLIQPVLRQGVLATKEVRYADPERGILVRNIETLEEELVTDIDRFLSLREARQAIERRASDFLRQYKYPSLMLSVRIAQELAVPNLTLNKVEWERRRKAAGQVIKPVYYQVKKGEMIVREGDKITQQKLDELATLSELRNESRIWIRFVGLALLLGVLFYVAVESMGQMKPKIRFNNRDLLFLALILLLGFVIALPAGQLGNFDFNVEFFMFPLSSTLYGTPLSMGAMMVSIFFGVSAALVFALVMACVGALVIQNSIFFFIYFLVGGFVAAISVQDCRERGVLLKAGLLVGLCNIFVVVAINMSLDRLLTEAALYDAMFALLGGVIAGIFVTGLIPLGEMAFGYTTNIKLLELANLDSPLLKQLMIVAPGTYHHSLIAGTMVEAAAKAIGANSLLCKVAAYYHDLGKIKKPDYFIENQTGRNRHEKLAPSMSSLILISHVKEGVELARTHRLGGAIIDIIQQHHGTSLISYFYNKAKEMRGQDAAALEEDDFRYPGPRPQTKEAGLVLLADMVEAASHTLQNPTPARVQGMVQKIINKAFSDGQLDQCELTLKDLHEVAKSFKQILNGIFHQRIEYPESAEKGAPPARSKENGALRQPAAATKSQRIEPQEQDQDNLKRLGI